MGFRILEGPFFMTSFKLETPRLILRPHQIEDIPFMVTLNSDPEVTRYTGDGAITELEAKNIVERLTKQFSENRMGRFLAIEKSSGEKIGWAGLSFLKDRQVVDLGYRLLKSKWGFGYATEASVACLKYGFEDLKLSEITARADALNLASIQVMKKLRMKQFNCGKDEDGEFVDYKIVREEFNAM